MDPLDSTLDELQARSSPQHRRKRGRYHNNNNNNNNHNTYDDYYESYDDEPPRKRAKFNRSYQQRGYNGGYNNHYRNNNHYNNGRNNDRNYNRNNNGRNSKGNFYSNSHRNNYHQMNGNRGYRQNNHYNNNYYDNHNDYNNNGYYNGKYSRNQAAYKRDRRKMNSNLERSLKAFHTPKIPIPSEPTDNYWLTTNDDTNTTITTTNNPLTTYGYVTLIMRGDNYIPGALILAHSLRMVDSKYALICMITSDVSQNARQALQLLYDHVVDIPYIKYNCREMKTQKQKEKYREWRCDAFTKWNILQINHLLNINFEKLLFLDADKIALKNIDHLFTDSSISCPAGTFSSPWTNKRNTSGLINYYPNGIKQGDQIPAKSIHDALYKNGFVAVGTGLLFQPNINEYNKFVKMLDLKWICDEYMENNIDQEKIKLRRLNNKFKVITDDDKDKNDKEQKNEENENPTSDFPEETEVEETKQTEQTTEGQPEEKKEDDPYKQLGIMEKDSKRVIGFRNCYSMLDEQSIVFFYYYHKKPWYYLDVKYNFIPWHFKWLENADGTLQNPSILHFFGMKPWELSPIEWRDLQSWWALVFNLLIWSNEEKYGWNQEQTDLVATFFNMDKLNELPLKEYEKPKTHSQDIRDNDDSNNGQDSQKKLKSRVACFWCYELAKRRGMDPEELIDTNDVDKIKDVFHFPIHPTTGKLCCPQLLNEITNPQQNVNKGNDNQEEDEDEDDDIDLNHNNPHLKHTNPTTITPENETSQDEINQNVTVDNDNVNSNNHSDPSITEDPPTEN